MYQDQMVLLTQASFCVHDLVDDVLARRRLSLFSVRTQIVYYGYLGQLLLQKLRVTIKKNAAQKFCVKGNLTQFGKVLERLRL